MRLIKGFDVGIEVGVQLLALGATGNWIAVTNPCPVYWYADAFPALFVAVIEIGPLEACDSGCGAPWVWLGGGEQGVVARGQLGERNYVVSR